MLGLFQQPVPYHLRAAQALQEMAVRGARANEIINFAQRLWNPSIVARIMAAWKALPTHYVEETKGVDDWQEAVRTLRQRRGDCEDWSVLLAAVLIALGVDARIATMPEHAAVVVPVEPQQYYRDLFGRLHPFVRAGTEMIPADWRCFMYQDHLWLPFEATTDPATRGAPGEQTAHIIASARAGTLYIANAG